MLSIPWYHVYKRSDGPIETTGGNRTGATTMFTVIVRFFNQPAHLIYTNDVEAVRAYYTGSHVKTFSVWTRKAA